MSVSQRRELFRELKDSFWQGTYAEFFEKYDLSSSFRFNGDNIKFQGDGKIEAGEMSYVSSNSVIQSASPYKVEIGQYCAISHNVRMYTRSVDANQDLRQKSSGKKKKGGDIVIGDGVWVGANVFIKGGVTIGANVVIGANSVVVKSIPEGHIVSGIPAKTIFVKELNENNDEQE